MVPDPGRRPRGKEAREPPRRFSDATRAGRRSAMRRRPNRATYEELHGPERFPLPIMQAAHDQALRVMKAMLGGFRAACEEVSLDPEVVLRTMAPHLAAALEQYREQIEEIPTDPDLQAFCTEELQAVWDHA